MGVVEFEDFQAVLKLIGDSDRYFLPATAAQWQDQRFRLIDKSKTSNQASGVRLQSRDRTGKTPTLANDVQSDLCRLIDTLMILRREPKFKNLVISKDILISKQSGLGSGKRVRFGLDNRHDRYESDELAAGVIFKVISSVIWRAGYKIAVPEAPFKPNEEGLVGLKSWLQTIELEKRLPYGLLALLLLPLLFFVPAPSPCVFGVCTDKTVIFLIDSSPSVMGVYNYQKDKIFEFLDQIDENTGWFSSYEGNVIFYGSKPVSLFNEIVDLDTENIAMMREEIRLNADKVHSGTALEPAFDLAIDEVVAHGKNGTLINLTDAGDGTFDNIISKHAAYLEKLDGITITFNAFTTRMLKDEMNNIQSNYNPVGNGEQKLFELTQKFNGQFGPEKQ